MRILKLHCDYIYYKPKKLAIKQGADEVTKEDLEGKKVEEVLVVFTAIENGDGKREVIDAVAEIKKMFETVKAQNIVIYPYAHLSSNLASLKDAPSILVSLYEETKKSVTPNTFKSQFGWYKEFELKCKGHPLSELSKTIGGSGGIYSADALRNSRILPKTVRTSEKDDPNANVTYIKLLDLLDKNNAEYNLIEHPPEGRTDIVSPMRGNKISQAAKCIILMIKVEDKKTKYVLAVVPGNAKIDLDSVKMLFNGTYISFATPEIAEKLAGSVAGTILPFSFSPELELIVDPELLKNNELYFNAARLDRSMALRTSDYVALTKPRVEKIAKDLVPDSPTSEGSRKPKAGTTHTLNEVIYSVMLEEPQNRGFAKDRNAYRVTTALCIAALLKKKDKNVRLGLMQLNENGFYVDIDLQRSLSPKELPELQIELEAFISETHPITQKLVSKEQAEKIFSEQKEPYLLELAQKLPEHAFLNLYCMDDICIPSLVPLLDDAKDLRAINLAGVGGAYWMNDSSKAQLQRITGFSFATKEGLVNFMELQEKAKDRDHRKIGIQLDLFSVQEVAPGMAFFHPKGMIIRNELEKYWRELNQKYGHVEIRTPILMDAEVWKSSGHWDHYKENMYFTNIDGKLNGVKPMNCPGAIRIFKNTRRSYRELPLRLAELGLVHRHEFSGVLSGLFRVRAFTQDDSHVFCAQEDIESEVESRLRYLDEFYNIFGFDYTLELSTRPLKRLGTDAQWDVAENALKKALDKLGKTYKINEGDGAFYGPKIDFHIKDSLGRTWQCATEQLDFQMPLRFNVTYVDKDGKEAHPAMLHSVAHGSVERFFAILVEHFEGKFPTWLAPVQVAVITVSDDQMEYAKHVYEQLKAQKIRVELEDKTGTVGAKIRNWQQQKVSYTVILGEQEVSSKTISVRDRAGNEKHNVHLTEFVKTLHEEIEKRK